MAKCKECGSESGSYRLCGNCKKQWKETRLKAYDITYESIGDLYFDTSKEFKKELIINEKTIKNKQ